MSDEDQELRDLIVRIRTNPADKAASTRLHDVISRELTRRIRFERRDLHAEALFDTASLFNEVWVRLMVHGSRLSHDADPEFTKNRRCFFQYAARIAHNLILNRLNSRDGRHSSLPSDFVDRTPTARDPERHTFCDAVHTAIRELEIQSPDSATVFELKWVGTPMMALLSDTGTRETSTPNPGVRGLTGKKIAELLCISEGEVSKRLKAAKTFITSVLSRLGIGPTGSVINDV